MQFVKQQSVSDVDLDVFYENALAYHYFITLFHGLIKKRIEDPRGRLTRLIKYTKGNPKEMIKHYVQQPAAVGYDNAKKLLQQKYGNPYSIMSMYRKEIKSWPQLKNGDGRSFQKFYNFLVKCENITKSREWNPLDTPDVICMLLSKLHEKIRHKWVRAVMDVRTKEHREGTLGDFIKLIHEEKMLVNDPLFSKEAVDQYTDKKSNKQGNSKKRINTFATHSKSDKEEKRDIQAGDPLCVACNEDHPLDSCKIFMEKTLKERNKLLANKKLCYGGYQPMTSNHNAKTCKQRLLCRICKEYHPTGMHSYVKKASEEYTEYKDAVKCASVKGKPDTEVISMCVVPVWIVHRKSRKMVKTYAMLDNCSLASFIKDEIVEDLGISGTKLKMSLKTLTGEKLIDCICS